MQNRPAFEIPYTEISNTNLAGKNEVSVEFAIASTTDDAVTNGSANQKKGRKAAGARDQLTEMRFYIPGTATTKKDKDEDGEGGSDEGEVEEQNAANLFYETIMDKADIGEVAGDTFATFLDVLHLTPRFVALSSAGQLSNMLQRTIRCRHVREVIPNAWENVRLQSAIRIDQEVHASTETRRPTHTHLYWSGSSTSTRPNQVSILSDAVQAGGGS